MNVKSCEMKMDKQKCVLHVRLFSGYSESRRVVGHKTKELLKFEMFKNDRQIS
jgi:hypothetical protein